MNGRIDFAAYMRMCKQVEALPEIRPDEITTAADHLPELLSLYEHGFPKGVSTGWRCLDELFTVRGGEFTVITGVPGHGKSSWLDNLMVNLSRNHQWRWAVFSAENYPIARHIASLTEIYSGRPFARGPSERMTKADLDLCITWIEQYFRFFQPTEDGYSLNRIVQLAAELDNLNALVIDPWNELDHSRPKDMREDEFISIGLSKLRWLARTANIHVFVVAHPAKFQQTPGEAKPVITLNNVKGASEWYAKADNGISIWRDEADAKGPATVCVQKIRFRDTGRIGRVNLYYDRVTGRFTDPNHRPSLEELIERGYGREPGCDDT